MLDVTHVAHRIEDTEYIDTVDCTALDELIDHIIRKMPISQKILPTIRDRMPCCAQAYSVNADLVIREKKDILVIPERLVTFEDGGKKASVELPGPGPKDDPRKVEIQTGLSDGLNVEVVSGLKEGDRVVERPPREIKG